MGLSVLGMALGKALIPTILGRLVKGKGKVAEKIAEAALEVTGLGPDSPEDQVMEALRKDPAAYVRLQEIAASEAMAEAEKEIQLAQYDLQDRQSARKMNSEFRDPIVHRLVWMSVLFMIVTFLTVIGMTILTGIYQIKIDQVWIAIVATLVGNASARFDQVFNFFLGSSQGSKDKTRSLSDIAGAG